MSQNSFRRHVALNSLHIPGFFRDLPFSPNLCPLLPWDIDGVYTVKPFIGLPIFGL